MGDLIILRHLGDFLLNELVFGDRLSKRSTGLGIAHACFETGTDNPSCTGSDRVTSVVEGAHRDFEAFTLLTNAIGSRDSHILKVDPTCRTGADAEFAVKITAPHARTVQVNDEAGKS